MANKMIDLSNIARLAAALDSRMKNKIEAEELRAKEEESNLLQIINRIEEMLGGKSLIYLTQAEYDVLAEEEKNNESIMYIITDAEDISHEHDNLEFLNSLNETDYMQLGTDIEALKNNKVDEAEYNSKISELTTNINNEINRATEKESEILADTTSKITEVENMLGGKSLVYLTQAEYDELTEEEKSNDEIIYFITDAQDTSHTHDNKEFLDGLSEDNFEEISNEIGALETSMSNEVSRVEAMLGGRSFVYLTQAEYDALSEEDKNDEAKIYIVTDAVSMSHVHDNKEFLDSLNEDIFNDIDSAIQLLENNKLDASIYNEVVPGLVDNSHTHENQDFLDELNEEEFAQMNADIDALKTSVSGKADTGHNHDDKYYTEEEMIDMLQQMGEGFNAELDKKSNILNYNDHTLNGTETYNNFEKILSSELEAVYIINKPINLTEGTICSIEVKFSDNTNLLLQGEVISIVLYEKQVNCIQITGSGTSGLMLIDKAKYTINDGSIGIPEHDDNASSLLIVHPNANNAISLTITKPTTFEINNSFFVDYQFVNDVEKESWNNKADQSYVDEKLEDINEAINEHVSELQGSINTAKSGAISESKTYTDTAITNLVDSAPDAMNTLNDLAKAINAHQTEYEAYVATVSSNITSAKNEAINEAGNKDEALHAIISKEIDDDVKEEHDRAVGVETGLQASITSLTNNKVDVAKYNDEVPGLLTAKHSHENLDALNSLTSEKISGYDASIKSLQDNKLDAATYNTDMVDLNAAKHTHENKTFLDTFTETKYNEIVSNIDALNANKLDASLSSILIWGSGEEETETYAIRYLCQGDKTVSPMVNMSTVIADDGTNMVTYINTIDESIQQIIAIIGNGDELLTDAKDTIVHCINELQNEINAKPNRSDLEILDDISLNGYKLWVGTSEELNNITKDPNTLYFEITDEEDSEEVVQVNPVDGVLTLTTNKYQKTTIADGTQIVFPEVNKFTEIHLYFDAEDSMNLTFPDCRWRVEPNIEAGKSYEIVATYNTIHWLVNVIVYS